ncbi:MAG: PTS glucose transporter subunit IIA [Clostridia bacterium]|nr:PTS glucose transporter subunit IIA [Clostridia bacterium]
MSNTKKMMSPQNGRVTTVLEIPDEVFSEKILGDGVAIIPTSDEIVSPVDGEIIQIAETGHAFCIRSDDGVEILIHVGVDTVSLKGRGFVSLVSVGQKVEAGEPIGTADIEMIKENGYPTHTAMLITNMGVIEDMEVHSGYAEAGKTVALSYSLK